MIWGEGVVNCGVQTNLSFMFLRWCISNICLEVKRCLQYLLICIPLLLVSMLINSYSLFFIVKGVLLLSFYFKIIHYYYERCQYRCSLNCNNESSSLCTLVDDDVDEIRLRMQWWFQLERRVKMAKREGLSFLICTCC